jgi:predicted DNA-binding ribbon-helix-helix protein
VSNRTHRSFTLRVEIDFYLELAEKAQAEGIPLNQLANRLLRLGLGKHITLDSALRALLLERVVKAPDVAVQA